MSPAPSATPAEAFYLDADSAVPDGATVNGAYAPPGPAAMAHARTSGRMLARGLRTRHDVAVQAGYREVARQLAARARGDEPQLAMRLPSGATLAELVR